MLFRVYRPLFGLVKPSLPFCHNFNDQVTLSYAMIWHPLNRNSHNSFPYRQNPLIRNKTNFVPLYINPFYINLLHTNSPIVVIKNRCVRSVCHAIDHRCLIGVVIIRRDERLGAQSQQKLYRLSHLHREVSKDEVDGVFG